MQVTLRHLRTAVDRVDVGVLKTGREQPATDVDDLGGGAGERSHVAVGPDRHDAPTGDSDCSRLGRSPVTAEDSSSDKDQIRV
jgi:hypothetical protein